MLEIKSQDSKIEICPLLSSSFPEVLTLYKNRNIIIMVDENTHENCLEYLVTSFPSLEKAEVILLPNGEENKVMEVCMQVWNAFTEYGFGRHDLVVNLGGGVVTDMGGFIASIYKRGMDFIHVPTSLLGMVDAAIGGKNGIDLGHFKNQLGTIIKARNVYIDTAFLESLPEQEFYNGYAEMLKYGLIRDLELYNDLKTYQSDKEFKQPKNIEKCIQIKVDLVDNDLDDKGERMLLNFGHTFGHAIEGYFLQSKPISHGHAVGIGMCAESYISMRRGLLSEADFEDIQALLVQTYPFLEFNENAITGIIALMYNDKKNENGKILSVLINSIGSASFRNELNEVEIQETLRYLSMLSASSN